MARVSKKEDQSMLAKVVIIGDTAVGKTNMMLRFINSEYKVNHVSTIGVDFKIKSINVEGVKIKMQIWDTAGQERFKTITETYYKGAAGVLLVYSVTDQRSFSNLENWIKQILETQPESLVKIIVGNKTDCTGTQRQVTPAEGANLAKKYNMGFMECSAKENINIVEVFTLLGQGIKKRGKTPQDYKQIESIKLIPQIEKKKDCNC